MNESFLNLDWLALLSAPATPDPLLLSPTTALIAPHLRAAGFSSALSHCAFLPPLLCLPMSLPSLWFPFHPPPPRDASFTLKAFQTQTTVARIAKCQQDVPILPFCLNLKSFSESRIRLHLTGELWQTREEITTPVANIKATPDSKH